MIDPDASLSHDLLEIAVRHGVAQIEEDGVQDDVSGEMSALE
jgi:hypothetical protein